MGDRRCVWSGVVLVVLACCWCMVEGQCPQIDLPADCKCTLLQQGTYDYKCSCHPNQQSLEISSGSVPPYISSIQFSHCSGSVKVRENAFRDLHNLENIVFHSIGNLILESLAIEPIVIILDKTFTLALENIQALAIEEEAIVFYPEDMKAAMQKIIIKHSTIAKLGIYGIIIHQGELLLQNVTLGQKLDEHSVDVGSEGVKVTIDTLDAAAGLGSKWIIGNVTDLTISSSNLNLLPQAFYDIELLPPNPSITLRDNQFGSLPTKALDVCSPDDTNISITATGNRLTHCRCEDLTWLLEASNATQLQQAVQTSLQCESGNLEDLLAGCEASAAAHSLRFSPVVVLVAWLLIPLTSIIA